MPETIDHIISGCPVLAPKEYKLRHDRVGQYIHWVICKQHGAQHTTHWYEHHPEPVTETENTTILWDFPIHTDRTIKANRPDIIIKDRKKKECLLIDVAIPSDKNTSTKQFEKLSKYKDLEIEVTKLWQLKTLTVPVIIVALGVITEGVEKYLDKIPGHPNLQEVQKITLTGTSHILRKALSM